MKLFLKHVKNTFSTCAEMVCDIKLHKLDEPGFMGSMHKDTEVPLLNSNVRVVTLSNCEMLK